MSAQLTGETAAVVDVGTSLTPRHLELAIRKAQVLTKQGWSTDAHTNGVFLNLARTEWIDVTAALQAVLLVETALLAGIRVTVALPLPRLRAREKAWLATPAGSPFISHLSHTVDRRRAALSFLQHLRFQEALDGCHRTGGSSLAVVSNYDDVADIEPTAERTGPEIPNSSATESETGNERQHLYQFCFPLTWFSSAEAVRSEMGRFLAFVAANAARGIELPDAESLSEVVLQELVENVRTHATEKDAPAHALVAALATPPSAIPTDDECYESEAGFFGWLRTVGLPSIAVVVGDSGLGVAATIEESYRDAPRRGFAVPRLGATEEADQLFWAFDRWSTRGELTMGRGTRGLYRLHRIVRKYRGLISMRSGSTLVGWDHGGDGYLEPLQQTRGLAKIPGTIVRLWLPPVHLEVQVPSLRESATPDTEFHILQLGRVSEHGLNDEHAQRLVQALATASVGRGNCVIACFDGGNAQGVRLALAAIVEAGHPAGVIVCGLPGTWNIVENCVDAINAVIDETPLMSDERMGTEVWGPVLVLGDEGQVAWAGADAAHRAVLEALIASPTGSIDAATMERTIPDASDRRRTIGNLRAEFHVVTVSADGSVTLRWRLGDVIVAVERTIAEYLANAAAVLPGSAAVRTPSLQIVRGWTDIDSLVQRAAGMRLAMLVLALRIREHPRWQAASTQRPIIATEDTRFSSALRLLKRSLGTDHIARIPVDAGPPLTRGQRLFHEGAAVVVYSTMPRSGDAARRVLKEVLREGGRPVAVACIVDARATTDPYIEVWGHEIPVIALVREDLHVDTKATDLPRISPVTHEIERASDPLASDDATPLPELTNANLTSILECESALYVGHIGRPVGRHFTFFVDALKLITADAIRKAVTDTVREWLNAEGLRDLANGEVWYPTSATDSPGGASERLADLIATTFAAARRVPTVRHPVYGRWVVPAAPVFAPETVVIADWGAITGATLSQMTLLAAQAGATRIFAIVCVSQLSQEEEQTLRSTSELRTTKRVADDGRSYLPGLPLQDVVRVATTARVTTHFITRLGFTGYLANCPVCQTQAALGCGPFPSRELDEYAASQEQLLSVRSWDEVHETPPAYLDGSPLDPTRATAMLAWRDDLQDALLHVRSREHIQSRLEAELERVESRESVSNDALALFHLLALESQWLRYAPLNMSLLRSMLARLATHAAGDDRIDNHDRAIAIRVLRYASKWGFAAAFAAIIESAHGDATLLREASLGAFTYLRRPYLTTATAIEPLAEGLRTVLNSGADLPAETRETLRRLEYRASMKIHAAPLRECSVVDAWLRLREFYDTYQPHDERYRAAARLQARPYVEALADLAERRQSGEDVSVTSIEPLRQWLHYDYERDWMRCCEFFDGTLLRLLERLAPVLQSPDADALGVDTWPTIAPYLDGQSVAESATTNLIRNIAINPDLALDINVWDRVRSEVRWWFERFLAIESRWWSEARLKKFLSTAPQRVSAIETLVRRLPNTVQPTIPITLTIACADEAFFCTEDLLQDVWFEIVENAVGHPSPEGRDTTRIGVHVERHDERIVITVSNSNSAPTARSGSGLRRLQGRLSAFDGELLPNPRPSDPQWTYEVLLRFQRVEQ